MEICSKFNHSQGKTPKPPTAKRSRFTRQSVRVVPMRIITISKKRSQGIQLVSEDYMEKIKHYCTIEDVQIRSNPKNTADVNAQIEGEDAMIMQHIKLDDWVVILDENGADIGSEQMAELLEDAGKTGSSRLSFCIGGPYGHGPQLRKRADVAIKLSSMVLNHQIAFVVLLEQLYRAWTILKGQKYHH